MGVGALRWVCGVKRDRLLLHCYSCGIHVYPCSTGVLVSGWGGGALRWVCGVRRDRLLLHLYSRGIHVYPCSTGLPVSGWVCGVRKDRLLHLYSRGIHVYPCNTGVLVSVCGGHLGGYAVLGGIDSSADIYSMCIGMSVSGDEWCM